MKYLPWLLLSCMLGCQKASQAKPPADSVLEHGRDVTVLPEHNVMSDSPSADAMVALVQSKVNKAYEDGFKAGELQGMRLIECEWLNAEYRNGRILFKDYAAMRKKNSLTCEKVKP